MRQRCRETLREGLEYFRRDAHSAEYQLLQRRAHAHRLAKVINLIKITELIARQVETRQMLRVKIGKILVCECSQPVATPGHVREVKVRDFGRSFEHFNHLRHHLVAKARPGQVERLEICDEWQAELQRPAESFGNKLPICPIF